MTMTDFDKWYDNDRARFDMYGEYIMNVLKRAFEAGAASQAKTLRDEFAGRVDGLPDDADDLHADIFNKDQKPPKDDYLAWAKWFAKADATLRYIRADAMLEARKTTGETKP
jgi:hypothetical protein